MILCGRIWAYFLAENCSFLCSYLVNVNVTCLYSGINESQAEFTVAQRETGALW